ncbi:HNH endonuclease [Sphingomonas aracearum]|uniref:HNH endonuclease n=1 Tax=Sphingomonas aracearum TaxID=2283317 RepID=UPI001C68896E|nr:HNH endonuclease [Sphingomonas aracearum]
MPDKPATFSSRPKQQRSKQGGSHALRDRSRAYSRLRERLLSAEPLCRYCRSTGLIRGATVLDHIVALALGGTDDPANLAPTCTDCNDAKSTAEKRFLAKGYDLADVTRDPHLADWLARAEAIMSPPV